MPTDKDVTTIRLHPRLKKRIKAEAKKNGRTFASQVEVICAEKLGFDLCSPR